METRKRYIPAALASGIFAVIIGHLAYRETWGEQTEAVGVHEETPAADPVEPFTDSERNQIYRSFDSIKAYWESQGVPLETSLVILENTETYVCGEGPDQRVVTAQADAGTAYCRPADTIIMTDGTADLLRDRADQLGTWNSAMLSTIIGHEFGHVVQKAHTLQHTVADLQTYRQHELQADCLSGQAVASVDPTYALLGENYSELFREDNLHGTPQQREEHFLMGAVGVDCQSLVVETD